MAGLSRPRIRVSSWGTRGEASISAIGRFPGHEAAEAGRERAGLGFQAIGDDQQAVVGEEAGDGGFVGLQLLEGGLDGGVFVGGVFEFDDDQGQAVDEEDHIRAVC